MSNLQIKYNNKNGNIAHSCLPTVENMLLSELIHPLILSNETIGNKKSISAEMMSS